MFAAAEAAAPWHAWHRYLNALRCNDAHLAEDCLRTYFDWAMSRQERWGDGGGARRPCAGTDRVSLSVPFASALAAPCSSGRMQYVLLTLADMHCCFGYYGEARLVRSRHAGCAPRAIRRTSNPPGPPTASGLPPQALRDAVRTAQRSGDKACLALCQQFELQLTRLAHATYAPGAKRPSVQGAVLTPIPAVRAVRDVRHSADESGSSVRQAAQVWRRDWFRLVDAALHGPAPPSSRSAAVAAAEAAAAATATTASTEQGAADAAYLRSIEFANSATDALRMVRTHQLRPPN